MNQHEASDIGYRIQLERKRLGLTQTELAELTGVSRPGQAGYEGGRSTPDLAYALKAAAAGIDLDFVLTGKSAKESSVDKFDWALANELMVAILEVAGEYQLSLPRQKLIPLLKVLYELEVTKKSNLAPIDRVIEMLKIAA